MSVISTPEKRLPATGRSEPACRVVQASHRPVTLGVTGWSELFLHLADFCISSAYALSRDRIAVCQTARCVHRIVWISH